MELAPLVLEPKEVPLVWGGRALAGRYGKPPVGDAVVGESWECFDANRVARGPLAGRTLGELRAEFGAALLGRLDPAYAFPLLTKFIDAQGALSVQVHPDDAYARATEGQRNGKTECWYILEAEPGAELVLGWNRDLTRDEYRARVADGSLGEVLRRVPVAPGDVFHLPAGTLHAIGAGIVLFETQQTSDLTYRIFDWNRLGTDGKPRELHVEKAADVVDWRASTAGALRPLAYALDGVDRTALVVDGYFLVERIAVGSAGGTIALEGMPLTLTALDRPLRLGDGAQAIEIAAYETAVVPAALETLRLRATDTGRAQAIVAAPPADAGVMERRLARAGVDGAAADAFLAQFA